MNYWNDDHKKPKSSFGSQREREKRLVPAEMNATVGVLGGNSGLVQKQSSESEMTVRSKASEKKGGRVIAEDQLHQKTMD